MTTGKFDSGLEKVSVNDLLGGTLSMLGITVTEPVFIGFEDIGPQGANSDRALDAGNVPSGAEVAQELTAESSTGQRAATAIAPEVSESEMPATAWLDHVASKFAALEDFDADSVRSKVIEQQTLLLRLRKEGFTADELLHIAGIVNRGYFSIDDLNEWDSLYNPEPGISESALPNISWLIHLARAIAEHASMNVRRGLYIAHLVQNDALKDRNNGYSYSAVAQVLTTQALTEGLALP